MFISSLILTGVLFASSAKSCQCSGKVPTDYKAGSGDVDFGSLKVVRNPSRGFILLKRRVSADKTTAYVSHDGTHWHRIETVGLGDVVAVSGSAEAKYLYRVSGAGKVLLRSSDGGNTWSKAALDFGSNRFRDMKLTIVGLNGSIVYADIRGAAVDSHENGFPTALYSSKDAGDNWEQLSGDVDVGAPVAAVGKRLVSVSAGRLVESLDDGHSWHSTALGQNLPTDVSIRATQTTPATKPLMIYQIEVSPTDDKSVFLVTSAGLFITHDAGARWCIATFGSDSLYVIGSVLQSDVGILVTTFDNRGQFLWRSLNAGISFKQMPITLDPKP